jgi:CheY-like chemotaxis protein
MKGKIMSRKILFIDDDVKRISSHIDMLRMEGYEVESEPSAQKALESFTKNPSGYCLIILDIMMPKDQFTREETKYGRETGLVLLKQLREISKDIPVIVLTVLRDPNVRERAIKLRANEYLLKPQFPSKLIEVVETYLQKITERGETV